MALVDLPRRDARALAIFGSYLLTCVSLIILICRDLYRQYRDHNSRRYPANSRGSSHRLAIILFSILSALCLYLTWYYMLRFFGHSYDVWAQRQSFSTIVSNGHNRSVADWIIEQRIGDWLKDVQLFRDAWETVLETPGRLFWAQPIFFITATWSLYISYSARSRHIAHPWAYMLLGQIVAISFAQNLFYLAVLLHQPRHDPKKSSPQRLLDLAIHILVPLLTIPSVALIPTYTHGPYFLLLLMTPHLALMLPTLYASVSRTSSGDGRQTRSMYGVLLAAAVILQIKVVATAYRHPEQMMFGQSEPGSTASVSRLAILSHSLKVDFFSHPAVSSVGSDVMLCLASTALWSLFGPNSGSRASSREKTL